MKNIIGVLVTIIYIALIIGITAFLYKKKKIGEEESRKLIHIGLSNCYLFAWIFMDNPYFASILPFLFIFINLFNYRKGFLPMMERKDKSFGTVYYAISITIITFILFQTRNFVYIGAIAILVLGYADGLAGLLGSSFKKYKFKNGKTLGGSIICFLASFFVSYSILSFSTGYNLFLYCFIISSIATTLELISTKGLDNLTVPLGVAVVTYYMTLNPVVLEVSTALSINCLIAIFVNNFGFLDAKGSIIAVLLGTITFVLGGIAAFISLITYFIGANLLTISLKKKSKTTRDMKSVLCNGLIFIISLIIYYYTKNEIFLIGFLVALAGSSSDTWSGEIGKQGKSTVKYIFSRKKVEKGTSGGFTYRGLLGGILGSLLIAIFTFFIFENNQLIYFLIVLFFGVFTSLLDSLLGEFIQVNYRHKKTKKIVEKITGKKELYEKIKGFKYIGNNAVNFISISVSTLIAITIMLLTIK